jgi:hypothetical protein
MRPFISNNPMTNQISIWFDMDFINDVNTLITYLYIYIYIYI